MGRPVLLDLFCCAGGAGMGYHRAGFDVVGVDNRPQPRYPFRFIRADAIEYATEHGRRYDAIHASPPCQRYSMGSRNIGRSHLYPDLIPPVRAILEECGRPWVIENVQGAPPRSPAVLCGSMFRLGVSGMWLRRHRYFESSFLLMSVRCRHPAGVSIGVYGNGTPSWHREKLGRNVSTDEWREAMGTPWMVRAEMKEAIPPAYTEYIGRQLLQVANR